MASAARRPEKSLTSRSRSTRGGPAHSDYGDVIGLSPSSRNVSDLFRRLAANIASAVKAEQFAVRVRRLDDTVGKKGQGLSVEIQGHFGVCHIAGDAEGQIGLQLDLAPFQQ